MIDFFDVSMAYSPGAPLALEHVNFHIDRGEFVFIIGESGSGKSTIVKLLTCEEEVTEGEIVLNGYSLNSIKKKQIPYLRRNIGMVFQDFRLIQSKTVFENVAFAMEIVGAGWKEIQRQVPLVLSTVGLRHKADTRPQELSGGEQQRIAIARAMVNNPMLILADEPTGNLDPINSEGILALLQEINRGGTTVVVCTHDREMVDRMKRRTIEIRNGQIIRDDESGFYGLPAEAEAAGIQRLRQSARMREPASVRSRAWGNRFHYERDARSKLAGARGEAQASRKPQRARSAENISNLPSYDVTPVAPAARSRDGKPEDVRRARLPQGEVGPAPMPTSTHAPAPARDEADAASAQGVRKRGERRQ